MLSSIVNKSLGYQISHNEFDVVSVNNAGDPFSKINYYLVNTLKEEKELVEFYAKEVLRITDEDIWGYCASGSTEAILNAMWMARKRFPPGTKIYASADSHFCVTKIADMLCMPVVLVPTIEETGEMDMDQLRNSIVKENAKHIIVILTMGTTIRNAYDDMISFYDDVVYRLPEVEFHVHVDGAFGGAIYPFMKSQWLMYKIDTFNMSFHKFFGCPTPCALFLTRKEIQNEIKGKGCFGKEMVCLPEKDYTISCSRNGTAVADMYHKIVLDEFFFLNTATKIIDCLKNRKYFVDRLPEHILYRESHELSMSVELMNLSKSVIDKLKPYGVSVRYDSSSNLYSTHLYICTHVSRDLLDEVIEILKEKL